MKPTVQIPYGELTRVARDGSPLLLHSVGRIWGIGQAERDAIADGKGVPGWALVVAALGVGLMVGAWARGRYPAVISRVSGN